MCLEGILDIVLERGNCERDGRDTQKMFGCGSNGWWEAVMYVVVTIDG